MGPFEEGALVNLFCHLPDVESPGWHKARSRASAAEILKTPRKPEERRIKANSYKR